MGKQWPKGQIGQEFTGDVYRAAAEEHLTSLDVLYRNGRYTLGLYTAGLAVEAIFRAYRCRISAEFDARHDLNELARASQFLRIVPPSQVEDYGAAMSAVILRWSNSHRYRSEAAIRAFLKRMKADRGIKGDFLKENARKAINGADVIVTIGVRQWKAS